MARKRSELTAVIGARTDGFSKKMKGLGSIAKAGVGAIAAVFGAVVGAGGGLMAFTGWLAETQKGMAEINTIAGVSSDRLGQLEAAVFNLGSQFGNTTQDSIKGMYDALSAGVPEENVVSFLEEASKLAISAASDIGTSVDVLTSVMNAYQIPFDQAGRVTDILFSAVKKGKTTLDELAPVISRVTPLAAAMGVSLGEVAAAMATLTAGGTKTAEASTKVLAVIKELSKPTKAMAGLLDKMAEKYGKNAWEANSLQEKLQILRTEINGNGEKFTDYMGSIEGVTGALALTGTQHETAMDHLKATSDAVGVADEAYNKMADTVSNRWSRAMGGMREIMNELGRDILPIAADALEWIIETMGRLRSDGSLAEWANTAVQAVSDIINNAREFVSFMKNVVGGALASLFDDIHHRIWAIQTVGETVLAHLVTALENALNFAIRGVNGLIEVMDRIPGLDLGEGRVPEFTFAEGFQREAERAQDALEMMQNGFGGDPFAEGLAEHMRNMDAINDDRRAAEERIAEWNRRVLERQQQQQIEPDFIGPQQAPEGFQPPVSDADTRMPLIPDGPMPEIPGDTNPRGPLQDDMRPPSERGAGDLGANGAEIIAGVQQNAVLKLFGDVGMIAEKVDKMAGLTGN